MYTQNDYNTPVKMNKQPKLKKRVPYDVDVNVKKLFTGQLVIDEENWDTPKNENDFKKNPTEDSKLNANNWGEKNRLLREIQLPLNPSGTKVIRFGLDPYSGFKPIAMICKPKLENGPRFSTESFRTFLTALPNILDELSTGPPKPSWPILFPEHSLQVKNEYVEIRSLQKCEFSVCLGVKSVKMLNLNAEWFTDILIQMKLIDHMPIEHYIEAVKTQIMDRNMNAMPTEDGLWDVLSKLRNENGRNEEISAEMILKFSKFLKTEVSGRVLAGRNYNDQIMY